MDPDHGGKRKRSPSQRSSPASRRSRPSPSTSRFSTPDSLKPLRSLFQVYTLFETVLPEDGPFDDDWFRAVLTAARSETPQEKCLAARLLLRMVLKFPDFAKETLMALIYLSSSRLGYRSRREDALCHRTRNDAFSALRLVATDQSLPSSHVTKLTRHLFNELTDVHKVVSSGRGSLGSMYAKSPQEKEQGLILGIMEVILQKYPKALMEELFDMWRSADRSCQNAMGVLVDRVLLRPYDSTGGGSVVQDVLRCDTALFEWTSEKIHGLIESRGRSLSESAWRPLDRLRTALTVLDSSRRRRDSGVSRLPRSAMTMRRGNNPPLRTFSDDVSKGRRREMHLETPVRTVNQQWLRRPRPPLPHPASPRSQQSIERGSQQLPPPQFASLPVLPSAQSPRQREWQEKHPSADYRTPQTTKHHPQTPFSPVVAFQSLSGKLSTSSLHDVCHQYGSVQKVISKADGRESALVVFQTANDARRCIEGIHSCPEYASKERFCEAVPMAGDSEWKARGSSFVWVPGPPSLEFETEIVDCFRSAGMTYPKNIIRIEGQTHGFILEIHAIELVNECLQILGNLTALAKTPSQSMALDQTQSIGRKRPKMHISRSCPDANLKNFEVSQVCSMDSRPHSFSKTVANDKCSDERPTGAAAAAGAEVVEPEKLNQSKFSEANTTNPDQPPSPNDTLLSDTAQTNIAPVIEEVTKTESAAPPDPVSEKQPCPEVEMEDSDVPWSGQLFLQDVFISQVSGDRAISLPSELHIRTKISAKEVLRLIQGMSCSCKKEQLLIVRPVQYSRQFEKLRKYLTDKKAAGIVHCDQLYSAVYLLPSSSTVCQALELKNNCKDAIICALSP